MSTEELKGAATEGIPQEGLLVVGFSGGADSTALAHWLLGQVEKSRILLAHVNHLLRGGEAERDQRVVEEFAQEHGLKIQVLRADIARLARERGQGLEECGRQVRYAFFDELAAGPEDRILTAHNADDNAETILLNLCRGAGPDGLCGIPRRRGKILRPLLSVSREEIEAYCRAYGLAYVTDSTNLEDDYARNRLRHQVVPVLKELNPRFVRAAGQAAELLTADKEFLLKSAKSLLENARNEWGLEAAALCAAPESLRARAMKLYLEERGCGRLEYRHIQRALDALNGGRLELPGGVEAVCAQGVFWAGKKRFHQPYEMPVRLGKNPLPGGKTLLLTEKIRSETEKPEKIQNLLFKNALDCDIMSHALIVRNRRPGDRFAPAGRGLHKPLKQIFQENRMPPPLRSDAPLLVCGGEIAWCPGAGAGERFRAAKGSERILMVELDEG